MRSCPAALCFLLTLALVIAAPVAAQQPGDIVVTEVLVNPGGTITDASGEWFELYNATDHAIDLKDWFVQDSAASGLRPMHKIASSVCVPSHGRVVLGNTTNTTLNGGVTVSYAYGSFLTLANSLDRIRIVAPDSATVIDRVFYATAGISAQNGISRELIDVALDNTSIDGPNWADAAVTSVYGPGGRGTPQNDVGDCASMPVELVGFGAVVDGNAVVLNWATASETNNAGFEVERRHGAIWHRLGFVEGHGTTTEAQAYRYRTEGLEPGRHVFRLRQVDYDGAFEYSPEVELTVELKGTFYVGEVYPNPFNPQTQFSLAVDQSQHVRAGVYDLLGREVQRLFDGVLSADEHRQITVDGSDLATGTYVILVAGETFQAARRIMLVK